MLPEEIKKKAYEKYPKMSRVTEGHGPISADYKSRLIGDANEDKRTGYIEAYKEISALPTIKGWVAREPYGEIVVFSDKPTYDEEGWIGPVLAYRGEDEFRDLKWPDPPIEVELPIIRK